MIKTLKFGLIATIFILPQMVVAEGGFSEVTWVPQIGVQMKTLKFEQKLRADTPQESGQGSLEVDMPVLSFALSAIYQKAYISIKYEDSFDQASSESDVPNTDSETNMERIDYSITLGYNLFDNMNIFVGYMNGETTLNPQPLCPAYSPPDDGYPPLPDCGDGGLGFPSVDGNKAQDNRVLGLNGYQQTYEEDGWYIGVSYVWRFGEIGRLSMSAAYAELDATYRDNWLVGSPEFINRPFAYNFEGDSSGLSIGPGP